MAFFLEKPKTTSTPYVLIDEAKGYIKIEGESFHEKIIEFFMEINEWLSQYLKTDFDNLTFDCKMDYFNSSTSKLLSNIIMDMDEHASETKKITVNWIAAEDNDIIIECGEDIEEDVENLTFNMVLR